MRVKEYKITCLKCKNFDIVPIDEASRSILWKNNQRIVSGRFRLDNQWGWQCLCGNNSILTKQESDEIDDKVNPDPIQIERVIKNLIPDNRKLFKMRSVA